jgi:hypothetical protein
MTTKPRLIIAASLGRATITRSLTQTAYARVCQEAPTITNTGVTKQPSLAAVAKPLMARGSAHADPRRLLRNRADVLKNELGRSIKLVGPPYDKYN